MSIKPFDDLEATKLIQELMLSAYPDNTPPNTFNVGTVGGISRVAASILSETGMLASIMAREARANTMVQPGNIYSLSRYNHAPIDLCVPATTQAVLSVPVSVLGNLKTVRFRTSDKITFGEFEVCLAHDVVLDRSGSKPIAYYDNSVAGPGKTETDPDCQTFVTTIGDIEHISIVVRVYQAKRIASRYEMLSSDVLKGNIVDVNYQRQLVSHSLYYDSNGASELSDSSLQSLENIALVFTTVEAINLGEGKSAFVSYTSDQSIRLRFSSRRNNFRPNIGSALIPVVYTSQGAEGNISQTPVLRMGVTDLGKNIAVTVLSPFTGGIDRPTSLRQKIRAIEYHQVKESLDTDFDISKEIKNRVQSLDKSKYALRINRTRNDFKRTWAGSVILTGPDGLVIPAVTADISTSIDEMKQRGWSLDLNSPVIYDAESDSYRLVYDNEIVPVIPSNQDPIYTVPFAIKLTTSPVVEMQLMRTSIEDEYQLEFKSSNRNTVVNDFVLGQFRINRDGSRERRYNISATGVKLENTTSKISEYKAVALIHDGNRTVGWRELPNWNASAGVFTGQIQTQDKYNPETFKFQLTNVRDLQSGLEKTVEVGQDLWLEVVLLGKNKFSKINTFNIDEDSRLYINKWVEGGDTSTWKTLANLIGFGDYVPISVYSTSLKDQFPIPVGTVNFWKSMSGNSSYDAVINEDGKIVLKNVPMVHGSYLRTSKQVSHFNKSIGELLGVMSEIRELLHNNTNIEFHFVNTHGVSRKTTANNLSIGIHMKLRTLREPTSEELQAIKTAIVNRVQAVNSEDNPISTFAYSNMARDLETRFDVIQSTELIALAGDIKQVIEAANTSKQDMRPEYLCVGRRPESYTDNFDPDIVLEIN